MTVTPARSAVGSRDPAQPDPSETGVQVRNVAFTLLSVAIVILLLRYMQPVLLPLVLSGLLFYALDPAVDGLQTLRVPRAIGAALMLFVVVAGGGVLAYTLQGQALTVINQLPAASRKLTESLRNVPGAEPGAMEQVQKAADELKGTGTPSAPAGVTRVQIEEPGFQARTFVWSTSIGLASTANQLIMVLFLTYFMLLSDDLFKRKLVEIVDTLSQKKVTVSVLDDIAAQIERFIVVRC